MAVFVFALFEYVRRSVRPPGTGSSDLAQIAWQHMENKLDGEIGRLSNEIADIKKQIEIDLPNASTVTQAFQNLDEAVHIKVRRVDDFSARISQVEQTAKMLIDWAISRATAQVIDALLSDQPKGDPRMPPATDGERTRIIDDMDSWVRKVGGRTFELAYGSEIQTTIRESPFAADAELREIPSGERPDGLDALAFRDYYVAAYRCDAVGQCLAYVIREIQQHEPSRLQHLREREKSK